MGERADLWGAISGIRGQAKSLREAAGRLDDEADRLEQTMHGKDKNVLGGQDLIEALVPLVRVAEREDGFKTFHYDELYGLLRDAGFVATGSNPKGTLLAALNRTDKFIRAGRRRSGLYQRRGE